MPKNKSEKKPAKSSKSAAKAPAKAARSTAKKSAGKAVAAKKAAPAKRAKATPIQDAEVDRARKLASASGGVSCGELACYLKIAPRRASHILRTLLDEGKLMSIGVTRNVRYSAVGK